MCFAQNTSKRKKEQEKAEDRGKIKQKKVFFVFTQALAKGFNPQKTSTSTWVQT